MSEAAGTGSGTEAAPVTVDVNSPEFKAAVKQAVDQAKEEIRAGLEAEYRRKRQELEATTREPQPANGSGSDYFADWGARHGLPADAGKELAEGIIGHVQGTVIPTAIASLTASQKRQELRAQRQEVRANAKLAKLDDRFNAQVMKLLEPLKPSQIGPDSYSRALHMVIGENIEVLDQEREQTREGAGRETAREREVAPGAEPLTEVGRGKPSAIVLNAKQKQFCEERGMTEADFVDMMRDRARKLAQGGRTKDQVRRQLGEMLGSLEY